MSTGPTGLPPLVVHEDDDLLVVHKPAGWNTHAPNPHAGEGIYDWLRRREPRWGSLAIIHRLDKETSGLLVFARSRTATQSLTRQFTERQVGKTYVLLTDRRLAQSRLVARSRMSKVGSEFVSRGLAEAGDLAETVFERGETQAGLTWVRATPLTGRTHQIRLHAQEHGFPILGDVRYGGTAHPRLCLHAAELRLAHPSTGAPMLFTAPPDFAVPPADGLRAALIAGDETNAYRLRHGAADATPGWYVDVLGDCLLSQAEQALNDDQRAQLEAWRTSLGRRSVYHKVLDRQVRHSRPESAGPQWVAGDVMAGEFPIRENGLNFLLSFAEGYSVGLFLDQRDNRRRLLRNHVAPGFPVRAGGLTGAVVLNTFAYTCGFSVAAAAAGAVTTSLDLSRKDLDWGRRNFRANGLVPEEHDFIFGDTFDWLKRFARQQRKFDLVLLDPPTFSQSKQGGAFRADRDYGRLVSAAVAVLAPGGGLFASTNAAGLAPEKFVAGVRQAVETVGRRIRQEVFIPQPPDFPTCREEPGYLKTLWLALD